MSTTTCFTVHRFSRPVVMVTRLVLLLLPIRSSWSFCVGGPAQRRGSFAATFQNRLRLLLLLATPSEPGDGTTGDDFSADAVIKIDDGGSDLTDRFKYKVNALMGVFDPQEGADDTERQEGNILNALLTFPVEYTFNVVGRTGGDDALLERFVGQVKEVVMNATGYDDIDCQVTPRGKSFTKVTVQATVQHAAMVAATYDSLQALELTVMRF